MLISRQFFISLLLISFVALSYTSASAQQDQALVNQGKAVIERVLDRYPKLSNYYKKPYLMGELTDRPVAAINIPLVDWQFLTDHDRIALAAFVSSVCNDKNQNSWVIFAGNISADGRDILTGKEVMAGQPH